MLVRYLYRRHGMRHTIYAQAEHGVMVMLPGLYEEFVGRTEIEFRKSLPRSHKRQKLISVPVKEWSDG